MGVIMGLQSIGRYGTRRLPLLFANWELLDVFGNRDFMHSAGTHENWLFVLRNKKRGGLQGAY